MENSVIILILCCIVLIVAAGGFAYYYFMVLEKEPVGDDQQITIPETDPEMGLPYEPVEEEEEIEPIEEEEVDYTVGQYVELKSSTGGWLTGKAILVMSNNTNIALNKPVSVSRLSNPESHTSTVVNPENRFSLRGDGGVAWAKVDLGSDVRIDKITIASDGTWAGRLGGCIINIYDSGNNLVYTSNPFELNTGEARYLNEQWKGFKYYHVYPPQAKVTHDIPITAPA